jgi:hypothetical protein
VLCTSFRFVGGVEPYSLSKFHSMAIRFLVCWSRANTCLFAQLGRGADLAAVNGCYHSVRCPFLYFSFLLFHHLLLARVLFLTLIQNTLVLVRHCWRHSRILGGSTAGK